LLGCSGLGTVSLLGSAQSPLYLGHGEGLSELIEKVEGFFKAYEVHFYTPNNVYRLGKSKSTPICVVFFSSLIQEKVLGKFGRRTLKKGDLVEPKMPHKDRSTRAIDRGIAAGKPDHK